MAGNIALCAVAWVFALWFIKILRMHAEQSFRDAGRKREPDGSPYRGSLHALAEKVGRLESELDESRAENEELRSLLRVARVSHGVELFQLIAAMLCVFLVGVFTQAYMGSRGHRGETSQVTRNRPHRSSLRRHRRPEPTMLPPPLWERSHHLLCIDTMWQECHLVAAEPVWKLEAYSSVVDLSFVLWRVEPLWMKDSWEFRLTSGGETPLFTQVQLVDEIRPGPLIYALE